MTALVSMGGQFSRNNAQCRFEIENTIGALIHELDLATICAGRTDAGVHARGQVIHFDLAKDHPDMSKLTAERINKALPEDIRLLSIEEAP